MAFLWWIKRLLERLKGIPVRACAVCVSVKNPVFCNVPSSRANVISCFTYQHYFLGTVFLAVFPNHLCISPFLFINITLLFFPNPSFTKAGPAREKKNSVNILIQ